MTAGLVTVMTAAATTSVTALSARARQDRVDAGQVEPGGVTLRDGNLAGTGDWIVTRRNDRRLVTPGRQDWVKNGDAWKVTARHPSGSLTVRRLGKGAGGTVVLPTSYATANVELLYATTIHRAQGATVDTAHPLITAGMTREHLYVAVSRAHHATTCYVVTHELPALDPDDHLDRVRNDPRMYAAREILTAIISNDTTEKSATETIRDTLAASESLATLAPRFQHALEIAVRPAYKRMLHDRYPERDAITQAPGYAQLRRTLLAGEQAGHHPARLLARVGGTADLAGLSDQELVERLTAGLAAYLARPGRTRPPDGPVPAWLAMPASAAYAVSDDIPPYLRAAHHVIAARVSALTEYATATLPAWTRALGNPPDEPHARAAWKNRLAVVAAWRDEHRITTSETRHVLGPRPDPGTSEERNWRHAATAITTARRLTSRRNPSATGDRGQYRPGSATITSPGRDIAESRSMPNLQPPDHEQQQPRQITW